MGFFSFVRVVASGLLLITWLGCESDGVSNLVGVNDFDDGDTIDTILENSDSDNVEDTATAEVDSLSDSGTEDNLPDPAEPCAPEANADEKIHSDVNQVTGVVVPDFGVVEEGEPFEGDLADDGPFDVFTRSVKIPIKKGTLVAAGYTIAVDNGSLSGTVYAPSADDGDTVAAGPFPLIVVLAGFQMSYTWYAHYSNHFASHGFAVLGFDTRSKVATVSHDKEAFEVKQALDWIETADTPLRDKLDLTKIAIAAHSKGGKIAFFTAALDHRVDLVIAWDPNNNGGPPCGLKLGECNAFPVAPNCAKQDPGIEHFMQAESLVLGMPRDSLNPDGHHNSIHFYRGAPSPASLVYYDAHHTAAVFNPEIIKLNKTVQMALLLTRFKGVPNLGECLPCSALGATNLKQHSVVMRVETK